jgi:tyrosinase
MPMYMHGLVEPMRDVLTSPADPLFWLHHANIDRIYTTWRTQHADSHSTIPMLSGSDLKMDPWEGTEPDYRHGLGRI